MRGPVTVRVFEIWMIWRDGPFVKGTDQGNQSGPSSPKIISSNPKRASPLPLASALRLLLPQAPKQGFDSLPEGEL